MSAVNIPVTSQNRSCIFRAEGHAGHCESSLHILQAERLDTLGSLVISSNTQSNPQNHEVVKTTVICRNSIKTRKYETMSSEEVYDIDTGKNPHS